MFSLVLFTPFSSHSSIPFPHFVGGELEDAPARKILGFTDRIGGESKFGEAIILMKVIMFVWNSSWIWNAMKWIVVGITSYVILALGEYTYTDTFGVSINKQSEREENIKKARTELQLGEFNIFAGKSGMETENHFRKALDLLNAIPPSSKSGYHVLLILLSYFQLWRFIMHRIKIGLYIDRFIMHWKGVDPVYISEVATASRYILKNYSGPLNAEWIYIALSSLNSCEALGLYNKVIEIHAACNFRISTRGTIGFTFRLFSLYLDWYLSSTTVSVSISEISSSVCEDGEEDCVHTHSITEEMNTTDSVKEMKMKRFANLENNIEEREFLLITQGCKSASHGNLKNGISLFKQAIQLSSSLTSSPLYCDDPISMYSQQREAKREEKEKKKMIRSTQWFHLVRALCMQGVVELLQADWKVALKIFKTVSHYSIRYDHPVGKFWGSIGLVNCFIKLGDLERAKFTLQFAEKNFGQSSQFKHTKQQTEESNLVVLPIELAMIECAKADLLLSQDKLAECIEVSEQALLYLKESQNDILFYSIYSYQSIPLTLLSLWEKLMNSSSINQHDPQISIGRVSRLAYRACNYLQKVSQLFPVLQPRMLFCKGQYYCLLKSYVKAKDYFNSALSASKNLGLASEEKLILEKFAAYSNQFTQVDVQSHRDLEI